MSRAVRRVRLGRAGIAVALVLAMAMAGVALASAGAGKRGPPGRPGPQGATGPKGIPGKPGGIALDYVKTGPVNNAPGKQDFATATCPAGEHVTGGGVITSGAFGTQWVNSSFPARDGTAWTGYVDNANDTIVRTFTVHAICAPSTFVCIGQLCPAKSRQERSPEVGDSKRGRPGPPGPQGAAGPRGDPGSSTLQLDYPVASFDAGPQTQTPAFKDCPNGEQIIGGGASAPGPFNHSYLNSTGPSGTAGWFGAEDRVTADTGPLVIYPVCTPKPPTAKVAAKHGHHRGRRGPTGPRGATGPTGPQGEAGSIPSLALTLVESSAIGNPHQQRTTGDANCPNGQHVTGGGVFSNGGWFAQRVAATRLQGGATGWEGEVDNLTSGDLKIRVYAICAPSDLASKR